LTLSKVKVGDFGAKVALRKGIEARSNEYLANMKGRELSTYLKMVNQQNRCDIDCGIAAFITILRLMRLYDLTVASIYRRFVNELDK
jgi:hypothetical protein